MKRDEFKHESFKKVKDKILEIGHYYDCNYQHRNIPIDSCPCDCYSEQIFALGMEAQEDLFNGVDRAEISDDDKMCLICQNPGFICQCEHPKYGD